MRAKECCKNCVYHNELKRWDYSNGGCTHDEYDGFACTTLLYEGTVIHMVGGNEDEDMCEMHKEKRLWKK